ncbi:MAG: tetratricopeptide repeat protein [Planctomycetes bacterium]|nr:tetratricopeptide repeat protein [Planctomycetota bacterium]
MTLLLALLCLQDPAADELDRLTARLKENPKDARALMQRGTIYQRMNQHDKAIADFDDALRLEPDNAQAHFARGVSLMALKRKDEALASWEKAVALDPKLKTAVEDAKSGRAPRRRGPEEDELARIEEKLRSPNLSEEERSTLTRRADELRRTGGRRGHMGPEDAERMFLEIRDYLKENDPETLRRLEGLRAERRMEEFFNELREVVRRKQEMDELKQRDPEQYAKFLKMRELERRCGELAEKIRRGDKSEDLRKELATALGQLFDLREEMRAKDLAELKRRVEELEKTLQKRRENKQAIIEKKLREMTGEKAVDDW